MSRPPPLRPELPFGLKHRGEIPGYFAWQAQLFKPYLRGRVLEHGAGTGALSAAMRILHAGPMVALEPEAQLVALLRERFAQDPELCVVQGTAETYLGEVGSKACEFIASSNVLEHLPDDVACLRSLLQLLRPGGALGLFVPARPELYGTLDRNVGHFRRYTQPELRWKLELSGFDVVRIQYRNLVGVLPWFWVGRILKRESIGAPSLRLFDRWVLPLCRYLEDRINFPYGLSLFAIARRADFGVSRKYDSEPHPAGVMEET